MEKKTIRSNTVLPPQHFTRTLYEVFVTGHFLPDFHSMQWIKDDYIFAHLFPSLKLDL